MSIKRYVPYVLVEKIEDSSLFVVPSTDVDSFSRAWVDNSNMWPEMVNVYDENTSEDVSCIILKIGTFDECSDFKKHLAFERSQIQLKQSCSNDTNNPSNSLNNLDSEKLIQELLHRVECLERETLQLREAQMPNVTTAQSFLVGSGRMLVSLQALQSAHALAGSNLNDLEGFKLLVMRTLGPKVFNSGNTWIGLGEEMKLNIQELLAFFVHSSFNLPNESSASLAGKPFSSLEVEKYEELFKKIKKKLLNDRSYLKSAGETKASGVHAVKIAKSKIKLEKPSKKIFTSVLSNFKMLVPDSSSTSHSVIDRPAKTEIQVIENQESNDSTGADENFSWSGMQNVNQMESKKSSFINQTFEKQKVVQNIKSKNVTHENTDSSSDEQEEMTIKKKSNKETNVHSDKKESGRKLTKANQAVKSNSNCLNSNKRKLNKNKPKYDSDEKTDISGDEKEQSSEDEPSKVKNKKIDLLKLIKDSAPRKSQRIPKKK